jgi:hypothetical protein
MSDPKAIGTVMALLVNQAGKEVKGGSTRGQLYVSPESMVIVRSTPWEGALHTLALSMLPASIVIVFANLLLWKNLNVLWIALAMQAAYWVTLPVRRRSLAPRARTAAELDGLRRDGRTIFVPGESVKSVVAPQAAEHGRLRRPARFELPDGALEIYLTPDAFDEIRAALGRA